MQMALGAGAAPTGVGWGYHDAVELRAAGARVVLDSFAEVTGAVAALDG